MRQSALSLTEQQIPAFLSQVGPGWHPLLTRLHDQLLALDADYRLDTFTVTLAGLRIAVADRFDIHGEFDGAFTDASSALTTAAEAIADATCQSCGCPGRPRFHCGPDGAWLLTLCEQCSTSRLLVQQPRAVMG